MAAISFSKIPLEPVKDIPDPLVCPLRLLYPQRLTKTIQQGDAERANIDGRIRDFEKQIINLKTRRNGISRIFRLPPELLSKIFIYHALANPVKPQDRLYGARTPGPGWTHVTSVCKHWRDVALNCPQMWSEIDFNLPGLARIMVDRSKQIPVAVTIPHRLSATSEPYASQILSQPHRLRSLTTSEDESKPSRIQEMTSPAPVLRNLNMTILGQCGVSLPDNFLGGVTPELRDVSLTGWKLPWTSPLLTGLTTLVLSPGMGIKGIQPPLNPVDFVGAFERMPHLRSLVIHIELPFIDDTTSRIARLPQLAEFSFIGACKDCIGALKRLALPTSAVLNMTCTSSYSDSATLMPELASALVSSLLSSPLSSTGHSSSLLRTLRINEGEFQGWFHTMPEPGPWYRVWAKVTPAISLYHGGGRVEDLLPALPLDQVGHINLGDSILTSPGWDHIGGLPRLTTLWAEGFNAYSLTRRLQHDPSADFNGKSKVPGALHASPLSFTKVNALYLSNMDFSGEYNQDCTDVDQFLDMLIWRYEHGGEIQKLDLEECDSLYSEDIDRIREVVVSVEWDEVEKEKRDEDEDDDSDNPHLYGRCECGAIHSDDEDTIDPFWFL